MNDLRDDPVRSTFWLLLWLTALSAVLMLASPASAQSWRVGDTTSAGTGGTHIGPAGRLYYPFTDATDSVVLTSSAEYLTVCLDPDITSASATGNAQVQVRCVLGTAIGGSAGATTNSYAVLGVTLDGDPSTSTACIYEVPCQALWIDVTASASGDDAVVKVEASR